MLTIKKIESLKPRTRLRKCYAVFHETHADCDAKYLENVAKIAVSTAQELGFDYSRLSSLFKKDLNPTVKSDICYEILHLLNEEPADWDFKTESGELDASKRTVLPITLILDRVRSPFNVGAIFRSADCFGVKKIILVEGTASPLHQRAVRTSRGTETTVEWEYKSEEEAVSLLTATNLPVYALELGGEDLNCALLSEGFCVIGSEEDGISPALMAVVKKRLSIPMCGTKGSLNVSVATGILLNRWKSCLFEG